MVLSLSATQSPDAAIHTFEVEWAVQNLSRESRALHSKRAVSASRSGVQKLLKLNRRKPWISISLSLFLALYYPCHFVLSHSFAYFRLRWGTDRPILLSLSAAPVGKWSIYKINGGKSCLLRLLLSFRSRHKLFNYPLFSIIFARYRSTIKSTSIYQSSLRAA